jgi:7,8-dihydro-6-hydroxymethylpterin dimethyltransferase
MAHSYGDETESVCPICLERIKARRVSRGSDVFMVKECKDHGPFATIIWRGEPTMDEWQRPKDEAHPDLCYGTVEEGCPFDCGLCEGHRQLPCSVLLEVTDRCNLRCPVCFADSNGTGKDDPTLDHLSWQLERAISAVGPTNLQLSGGEPTLRDDLPEIVREARRRGYSFIQVNSNGLRLASDKSYAERLRDAGLLSVFLQFDGIDDAVHRALRGRDLFRKKLQAIQNCEEAGLGVVLVPTLVKGINSGAIGDMARLALHLAPTVRGIHFQPISYFGRFPEGSGDAGRFTLPELMRSLEEQSGGLVKVSDFSPPGTEHAHCSFHATYIRAAHGGLKALGARQGSGCCSGGVLFGGGVKKTIETVSRRWSLPTQEPFPMAPLSPSEPAPCCGGEVDLDEPLDLDRFLDDVANRSFTISAMAFQDVENLDLERLKGCCISVISRDGRLIPFCAYNLTSREGRTLYRPSKESRQS